MKYYPSIDRISPDAIGKSCIAFRKIDGSCLRFEWSKKRGWFLQGTRTRMFDKTDPEFGCALDIFDRKYAEGVVAAATNFHDFRKPDGLVAFAEFLGPQSFAGWHDPIALRNIGIETDDNNPKDLVLFDVNINKRGFVGPVDFLKAFGHLHIPEVIFQGILSEEFVTDVRTGKYGTGEGVVCKGGDGFRHSWWAVKIKTLAYLKLLKQRFGVGGWQRYWE